MLDEFLDAIQKKAKIRLTFHSKKDKAPVTRLTAPMDYAPSTRAKNKENRYHFWDYESDKINHTLSLLADKIIGMEFLEETFEPSEFVTWVPNWHIKRDWGKFS